MPSVNLPEHIANNAVVKSTSGVDKACGTLLHLAMFWCTTSLLGNDAIGSTKGTLIWALEVLFLDTDISPHRGLMREPSLGP